VLRYMGRRLWQALFVLLGVTVVVFLLVQLAPGDPARLMLRDGASDEDVAELRASLGLDRPLVVQYGRFLGRALRGDLGESFFYRAPAIDVLIEHVPNTFLLAGFALMLSLVVGVPLGVASALRRDSAVDYASMLAAMIGQSVPVFALGLFLIYGLAVRLRWLPTSGAGTWRHLVLPGVTLAASLMALITRLVRSGMLDVLGEDFVRTARAKGVSERWVVYKHALRNIMIPLVTVVGLQLGTLLGGAVVTEIVFAWPGLGRVAMTAIRARDFPVLQAVVLMLSAAFVLINLLVDVLYAYLDPRIRYG
jgi:peptide/nickel transport system permease protein